MKTIQSIHPKHKFLQFIILSILCLCFSFKGQAQFQIVAMYAHDGQKWNSVYNINLTIQEPGKSAYTGNVNYDVNRQYASGTLFTTGPNVSIAIFYKDQQMILAGNTSFKATVDKAGVKAQTLKGTVRHVLKDVKQKVGFYRAGNGHTWAHAEGTDFMVEAEQRSKDVKIATSEGTITIIDEVPVTINQNATNNIGGKRDHQLTASVRTRNSAGDQYNTQQSSQAKVYRTYEEAIRAFEQETNYREQSGNAYVEELAENFGLIGELYMEIGDFNSAIEPLGKAVEYLSILDEEDPLIIDTSLYYCEALVNADSTEYNNIGNNLIYEIINILVEEINNYVDEYNYAIEYEDYDLAWDLCYDLSDLFDYLGWSYELLDDEEKADEYYARAEYYESRL